MPPERKGLAFCTNARRNQNFSSYHTTDKQSVGHPGDMNLADCLTAEAIAIRELGASVIDATDIGTYAVEYAVKYRGGNGVHDATTNVGQVAAWWSGPYKGHNIGIRVPESMFMLDVDGPDRFPHPGRGLQALAEAERQRGSLPATLTQITGSGGLHMFFKRPKGKLSKAGLPPGLEYKDRGGYVVGAPSVHPDSGERYVWCDHPVAAPPPWLVDMIVERPEPRRPEYQRRNTSHYYGSSPADNFNATMSWADVLMPHGWVCRDGDTDGDGAVWLHPKATSKCSATVRNGCLFVYSPNTPFEVTGAGNRHGYTKFRVHAVLNHGGDMKAAARAIIKDQM